MRLGRRSLSGLVIAVRGPRVYIERICFLPVRSQSHVVFPAERRWGAWRCLVVGPPHFPPALAAVIVLVVDHEAGLLHHRSDPAHAVVTVVAVLHETVANEEALRR